MIGSVEGSGIKCSYRCEKTNNKEWNATNGRILYSEILMTWHVISVPHNVYDLKQAKFINNFKVTNLVTCLFLLNLLL